MRGLFAQARDLGAREVGLEVITENTPAIALYEKLGFETTCELEVLSLAEAGASAEAEEVDVGAARRVISRYRDAPEPWQREDATVTNLTHREPAPQGLVAGEAAAVYRHDGTRVGLLQAAGEPDALPALIAALRAKGPVSAVNYPAGGSVAVALADAGAELVLRQYEMRLAL
jgi:Acetyltransferase (GNAT) family